MNWEIAENTLLRETRERLDTCPSTSKPTCTRIIGSGGSCTRLSKFLTGGVFKSSVDDTQGCILLMTLKLIVMFTTHWSVSGLNVPGSESMVFHGIFPCSFEKLTVAYSGMDLFKTKSAIAVMGGGGGGGGGGI